MYKAEQFESNVNWLIWSLENSSGLDSWNPPYGKDDDPEEILWQAGIKFGKNYKPLITTLKAPFGESAAEIPEEFLNWYLPKSKYLPHMASPSRKKKLYLRQESHGLAYFERNTYDLPRLGLQFEGEKIFWEATDVLPLFKTFIKEKQKQILEEVISVYVTKEKKVEEKVMAYNSSTTVVSSTGIGLSKEAPKKTLTISPVNARVLRMQSLKMLRALTKSFVEEKLPKEQRVGVMKVIGDILDRDIPDGAILSLASWASTIVPVPERFQGIAEVINKEFHDEGEALIKDAGIDVIKEVAGPVLMNLYSMAEKYFEEVPVEVGPDKQIEPGLDIKAMKEDLESQKVTVPKKSAAQKVA